MKDSDCFGPHALLHSFTGFGAGLVVVSLYPHIVDSSLYLGIAAVLLGIAGEFVFLGKKGKKK